MDIRSHVKLNGLELRNAHIEVLTSDPALVSADIGRIWYRSDINSLKMCVAASTAITLRASNVAIVSGDITDGTIVLGDLSATLKPSGSAAATDESLRALGATANTALAGNTRLDQIAAPTASVALNNQKITGLADGTAATDAITLGQLSSVSAGKDYKESVAVTTIGSETYVIASGSVTSLTGLTAGTTRGRVDGVEPSVGDRILIKNAPAASGAGTSTATGSSTQPANGVYSITGGTTTTLTLSRATDADASAEVTNGLTVWVGPSGASNPSSEWTLTTPDAITVGTTSLTFAKTGTATPLTASVPLTLTGMALALGYAAPLGLDGSNNLTLTGTVPIGNGGTNATTAAAARTNLAATGKYVATIGDGAATSITVTAATHGLGTSGDFAVRSYDITTPTASVAIEPDITVNRTTGDVTFGFATAPASNSVRIVIVG